MRKMTKWGAVISGAALLAAGYAMSASAATGWQEEYGAWMWYDSISIRVIRFICRGKQADANKSLLDYTVTVSFMLSMSNTVQQVKKKEVST